jgi:sulfur-oxidizing protein SoxY
VKKHRDLFLETRRHVLRAGVGVMASIVLRPARGAPAPDLATALREFSEGKPITVGRVKLDISLLIENGNAAPITVSAESPMTTTDHVRRIAIFNERNPQRDVAVFTLGPRAGKASISTRIRLKTSQRLVAVAEMSDGSFWQRDTDVIVTLAACIET